MSGLFNANYRPIDLNPEQGMGALDGNYGGAFSGIPGVNSAMKRGDNTYFLYRGTGDDRMRAKATVGPGGRVSVADWIADAPVSDAQMALQGAALAAAAYGGLSAGGFLGAPGAGIGAGAGAAGEAAAGSGLGITEAGLAGMGEGAAGVSGLSTGGGLSGMTAGGATGGGLLSNIGGKALDFATKNPRMVAGLLGAVSGGAGSGNSGGGGYTGPMPTITQGNWSPSVQAQSMPVTDVSALTKMPKKGLQGSGLFRFMG